MPKRKTIEEFKTDMKEYFGRDPYTLKGDYINKSTAIPAVCNTCNNDIEVFPFSVMRVMRKKGSNPPCKFCNVTRSLDYYNKLIKKRDGYTPYEFLEEYKGATVSVKAKCLRCNNEIKVIPTKIQSAIENNTQAPCKFCAAAKSSESKLKSTISYKTELDSLFPFNESYDLLEDYVDSNTPIKHRCQRCSYEWHITPNNILSYKTKGTRICPSCNNKVRDEKIYKRNRDRIIENLAKVVNKENDIYKYILNELGISNIIRHSKNILPSGKELDIYLPDYNLAIEINDLYNDNEKHVGKNYHLDKLMECQNNGIRLLQFFNDTVIEREEIVKDRIKHTVNMSEHRIYARKCEPRVITVSQRKEFLNKNHIQGDLGSYINLGLFYGDELVAVLTFCKLRKNLGQRSSDEAGVELARYATKLNHSVIGGFSKLLKYFKNSELSDNLDFILTYADRDNSVGNLYEKNNFVLTHISKPSYFYVEKSTYKRHNRFSFRKNTLDKKFPKHFSPDLTEFQIVDAEGSYYRVWNTGNNVYRMSLKGEENNA